MGMYTRERISAAMEANKTAGLVGPKWDNHAVALATLQDEVSGEGAGQYDLTPEIRDTLLAHARQDAANALANSNTLLKEVQFLRRLILVTLTLVAVCTVIVVRLFTDEDDARSQAAANAPAALSASPAPSVPAQADPLAAARDAIAKGADRNKVIERLKQYNIDPAGL